jgi:hypothetical protein
MKLNAQMTLMIVVALNLVGCMQKEVVNLRTKQKPSTSDRIKVIEQQIKDNPEVSSEEVAYLDTIKVSLAEEMSEDLGEAMEEEVAEVVSTDESIVIEDESGAPGSAEVDPAAATEEAL